MIYYDKSDCKVTFTVSLHLSFLNGCDQGHCRKLKCRFFMILLHQLLFVPSGGFTVAGDDFWGNDLQLNIDTIHDCFSGTDWERLCLSTFYHRMCLFCVSQCYIISTRQSCNHEECRQMAHTILMCCKKVWCRILETLRWRQCNPMRE